MERYVALLRAINVGGTGKLTMNDLRALAESCGLNDVRTYIQSGNLVFNSKDARARIQQSLESTLQKKMGKPVGVLLRNRKEMEALVQDNPFPDVPPNRLLILFLDHAPKPDSLKSVVIPGNERLALGKKEVYVHFPDGMGKSKLKLPFQKTATARNLNTTRKLLAMLVERE